MIEFTFENVNLIEFGVGLKDNNGVAYKIVPVHTNAKTELLNMARTTWNLMNNNGADPEPYSPAAEHASMEYLFVPINDDMANKFRILHSAQNIMIDGDALTDHDRVTCYFTRYRDADGRSLTAVRQANFFKGVLNKKLLNFIDDSLRFVETKVFKLDNDFDVFVDSTKVHILRPKAFEVLGNLNQFILDSVNNNLTSIQQNLRFLDIQNIQAYASTHVRAARYLASIRNQNLAGITRDSLATLCRDTNVNINTNDNQVTVSNDQIIGFLQVLDRRRYRVDLVPNAPERFTASRRVTI